ncbi:galactoside alpha-(1,2)-fucosyltransferase 1-like [Homarus americanus]|uniref:galactoside alpha-(1,2)-fucosyltransferase 1-like n=1 Tax=Homarus americanus TaxID=6706 RepID=UPI001C47BFB5|nr:galactoside alpha-(1,2)-fucosyltransferase 1-like [Homarus americanus]
MRFMKLERLFTFLIIFSPLTLMVMYMHYEFPKLWFLSKFDFNKEDRYTIRCTSGNKCELRLHNHFKPNVEKNLMILAKHMKKVTTTNFHLDRGNDSHLQVRSTAETKVGFRVNSQQNPESNLKQSSELNLRQNVQHSSLQEAREQEQDVPEHGCLPLPPKNLVHKVPLQDCSSPHVVMHSGGRLGNKMCQFFSLYLLRHFFGIRVSIKKKMHENLSLIMKSVTVPVQDSKCFTKHTESILYGNLYNMLYKAADDARAQGTQDLISEPLLKNSYYVSDHPCPRDLILAHRDVLHDVLAFKEDLLERARDNINNVIKSVNKTYIRENVTLITVHVRRGDYTRYLRKHYGLTQIDELYYKHAFDYYRRRVVNPVFVVVSADHEWCIQYLQDKDVVVAGNKRDVLLDMAILTLGDHTIISYGTFGFLGAALGHGNFTYPSTSNKNYRVYDCVHSPAVHSISRDHLYTHHSKINE